MSTRPAETRITHRVNYSETDAMGVAYHGCYVIWLEIARTEYLRQGGMSYAEVEKRGYRLVVGDLSIRYLASARYDDEVTIRCRATDVGSRRVRFDYVIERATDGQRLATATTTLYALNETMRPTHVPSDLMAVLTRLGEA